MYTIIMSEEERKEILDWIYLKKNHFIKIRNRRLIHLLLENVSDVITTSSYIISTSTYEQHMGILKWYNDQIEYYTNNKTISPYDPTMPQCIWKIKQRLIEKENLFGCKQEPIFQDFIMVIPPTAFIHNHVDSNEGDLIHCRYNIIIEKATKGGEAYYSNRLVNAIEGSYVLCKSGLDNHYTYPVEEGNRITLSFGFLVPKERANTMMSVDMSTEPHFPDFSVIHRQEISETALIIEKPLPSITKTHFDLFKDLKK
jgi:hypothetical protein